jgi:hypothetical protein
MEFLAAGFSSLISVFVLAIFVAGVLKLFQIHTVLMEIREGLKTAPQVSPRAAAPVFAAPQAPVTPTALHSLGSGDDMLRALDAQMKWEETAKR